MTEGDGRGRGGKGFAGEACWGLLGFGSRVARAWAWRV